LATCLAAASPAVHRATHRPGRLLGTATTDATDAAWNGHTATARHPAA